MNPRTLFIAGLAVASLAVAAAFRLHSGPAGQADPAGPGEAGATAGPRSSARPGPAAPRAGRSRADEPGIVAGQAALALEDLTIGLAPGSANDPVLAARAAEVERHAHRELGHLTRSLELDRGQRARLFAILAAGSADYHPAMRVPGLTPADAMRVQTGDLGVDDVLLPVQQEQRIERSLEDAALWREIFETLKRQLDESMPGLPPADTEPGEPGEPTPAPPLGRRNLLELLDE
jgi:hypothetical protein